MTVCNMTIEGGGRAGMIAPDETTFDYVIGRAGGAGRRCPTRGASCTPTRARLRHEIVVDAAAISPMVTWGTNPGMVVGVADAVPEPESEQDERALDYMGLEAGTPIQEITLDRVFIGSCTNSRIGDLRAAAEVVGGRKVADGVYAMVVPGSAAGQGSRPSARASTRSSAQAGFDWRGAGCSMCLGMNPDIAAPGERVASTSNRNFEGRQGAGARSHLVSPQMAAAAAIEGRFVDIRDWESNEMKAIETITGRVSVLNRDDVDTDQIIPKQFLKRVERTGFGEFLFYDWAKEPGWDLPGQPDPRRRAQLRLRLEPRARAVGAGGLRLSGDHRAELRRHLPLQLHEGRPAARCS